MIQLKSIKKIFYTDTIETTALSDITLTVEEGEFIAVMGPSGCGKSTLLNIIGLLERPSQGQLILDQTAISYSRERTLARLRNEKIGFIFQSFHLINELSVMDNVETPLIYRRMSRNERKRRVQQAIERVGLESRVKHFPAQLSGGQQQRVAIARALVGKPKILLADEPTGNLDSIMSKEIMTILQTLNTEAKTTIVMVTHDERLARQANRVLHMMDGCIIRQE